MFHESLMIRWENLFWGLQKPKSTLSERCLMLYPEHMFMHLWTQLQARIYFILFVSFFKKCWQWPNEVFLQPIGSVDENNQLLFSFSVMSNSLQHRGLHTPGFLVLHCLPKFAQTHVHWVSETSNHLILCFPLFLLPSVFPSTRVFSTELALCIKCPKYWSFSFSISPSNEYSLEELVSFRMSWFDLLAVQGTLKSLLQHHSSKAILWCSAFFMVQLSHPYMATGKTIALTALGQTT